MSEDTSKVLVCYATGTGCTEGVARRIGEALESAGASVDVRPVDSAPNPTGYDAIVAGSGTRAGNWHPAAKKWLTHNAPALAARPLVLFTVGIALAHGPEKRDEVLRVTDRLLEKTGLRPLDIGAFAGWNVSTKFNLVERKIMKIAKAPAGDFRDWAAIEEWATAVAPKLTATTHASVA